MKNIKEAMLRQSIVNTIESAFFKEHIELPDELRTQSEQIHSMREPELDRLFREILKVQKEFVTLIEPMLDELINTSDGNLPLKLTEQVTWKGYRNDTEEIVEMTLEKGTELNWLEFLVHPISGMIFQICLGSGSSGHHFNIKAKHLFPVCEDLQVFLKDATRLALEDEELNRAVYGELINAEENESGSWS